MTAVECLLWWKCKEYESMACLDCGHNMLQRPSFHKEATPVGFLVTNKEEAAMFTGIDRPMYQPRK